MFWEGVDWRGTAANVAAVSPKKNQEMGMCVKACNFSHY